MSIYTGINNSNKNHRDISMSLKILEEFYHGNTAITSSYIHRRYHLSIENSSNKLRHMFQRKWLKRKRNPNVKNGYQYYLTKEGIQMIMWMVNTKLLRTYNHNIDFFASLAHKNNINMRDFNQFVIDKHKQDN